MINGCTSTDWPNGLAHMVAIKLNNEYEPDNRMYQIELIRELSTIMMNISDEPKDLFDKVSCIQRKFM